METILAPTNHVSPSTRRLLSASTTPPDPAPASLAPGHLPGLLQQVALSGMVAAESRLPAIAKVARAAGAPGGVIEALLDVTVSEVMRTRALSRAVASVLHSESGLE